MDLDKSPPYPFSISASTDASYGGNRDWSTASEMVPSFLVLRWRLCLNDWFSSCAAPPPFGFLLLHPAWFCSSACLLVKRRNAHHPTCRLRRPRHSFLAANYFLPIAPRPPPVSFRTPFGEVQEGASSGRPPQVTFFFWQRNLGASDSLYLHRALLNEWSPPRRPSR